MRLATAVLALLTWPTLGAPAVAHEVRPALLEITQRDAHHYDILWKQPVNGEVAVHLEPRLSGGALDREPNLVTVTPAFALKLWKNIPDETQPLDGQTLTIQGLERTITDVLVNVTLSDGRSVQQFLKPQRTSVRLDLSPRAVPPVGAYLSLGIEHILTGIDHLLFVFGLLLLVGRSWAVLKTITAFTIAHSVTLAATALGWLHVRSSVVEALVALSIVVLAVELVQRQGKASPQHVSAMAPIDGDQLCLAEGGKQRSSAGRAALGVAATRLGAGRAVADQVRSDAGRAVGAGRAVADQVRSDADRVGVAGRAAADQVRSDAGSVGGAGRTLADRARCDAGRAGVAGRAATDQVRSDAGHAGGAGRAVADQVRSDAGRVGGAGRAAADEVRSDAGSGTISPGLTSRYPWLIAFLFGLLHGCAFAGALAEVGLPQEHIPLALFLFNVGVEIGQLLFIAAAAVALWLAGLVAARLTGRWTNSTPAWTHRAVPYAIGVFASYWFIERFLIAIGQSA